MRYRPLMKNRCPLVPDFAFWLATAANLFIINRNLADSDEYCTGCGNMLSHLDELSRCALRAADNYATCSCQH